VSPSQVIVLATPVFLLLIALEIAYGVRRGRNTYRLNDAINSISLRMLSQVTGVLTRLFRVGIYVAQVLIVRNSRPGAAAAAIQARSPALRAPA
jgi:hypothetical protein